MFPELPNSCCESRNWAVEERHWWLAIRVVEAPRLHGALVPPFVSGTDRRGGVSDDEVR